MSCQVGDGFVDRPVEVTQCRAELEKTTGRPHDIVSTTTCKHDNCTTTETVVESPCQVDHVFDHYFSSNLEEAQTCAVRITNLRKLHDGKSYTVAIVKENTIFPNTYQVVAGIIPRLELPKPAPKPAARIDYTKLRREKIMP